MPPLPLTFATRPAGRTLGVVAAFEWEVGPLLRTQTPVRRLGRGLYSLSIGGEPAVLAIAGMGRENAFRAAQNLIGNFSLRGLATLGFAGGLADGLRRGDVLLADRVVEEATGERFDCRPELLAVRFARRGDLLSVGHVVASAAEKRRLVGQWGTLAADMESAGVAAAALRAGLPFCAIKAITDSAEQSISIDFERCRGQDGTLSLTRIMREGMKTLRGTGDLWRLAWSSRRAAGSLAAAFGSV